MSFSRDFNGHEIPSEHRESTAQVIPARPMSNVFSSGTIGATLASSSSSPSTNLNVFTVGQQITSIERAIRFKIMVRCCLFLSKVQWSCQIHLIPLFAVFMKGLLILTCFLFLRLLYSSCHDYVLPSASVELPSFLLSHSVGMLRLSFASFVEVEIPLDLI